MKESGVHNGGFPPAVTPQMDAEDARQIRYATLEYVPDVRAAIVKMKKRSGRFDINPLRVFAAHTVSQDGRVVAPAAVETFVGLP